MRVAASQVAPAVRDVEANRALVEREVRWAVDAGVDVLVLPELVTSGYVLTPAEVDVLAEPADGPTVDRVRTAIGPSDLVVVLGLPESGPGGPYNSAVLVTRDGLAGVYRKAHLWADEPDLFTAGSAAPLVVDTRHGRLGVVVCYDLEFPEWVRACATDGVELLCAPTNWPAEPTPDGERPFVVANVLVEAGINRLFVAACDRVGDERGVTWTGGSVIAGPTGFPRAEAVRDGTSGRVVADCLPAEARDKGAGPRNDRLGDRRPDLYRRTGPGAPAGLS